MLLIVFRDIWPQHPHFLYLQHGLSQTLDPLQPLSRTIFWKLNMFAIRRIRLTFPWSESVQHFRVDSDRADSDLQNVCRFNACCALGLLLDIYRKLITFGYFSFVDETSRGHQLARRDGFPESRFIPVNSTWLTCLYCTFQISCSSII